jgi:phasin family protein
MSAKENLGAVKELGNKGMENLNELTELNMKVLEKITSRQMEALNFIMSQSKRQMQLATEAKGYGEFMKGQVELAKETSERMLEETKANMQIANEVRDDYRSFVQKGMGELSEEVKKVAPDVLKK